MLSIRFLNAIACWAHRVYGIPKIMLEFVEIQFAETNPELSKIVLLDCEIQRQILQGADYRFQLSLKFSNGSCEFRLRPFCIRINSS